MEKGQKERPPFGPPKSIVLLETPDGWRHSILTVEGRMFCGRLSSEPLDPDVAMAAATTMLEKIARDLHDTTVEVTWDPRQEPGTWTARVVAAPVVDETAPTDSEGETTT